MKRMKMKEQGEEKEWGAKAERMRKILQGLYDAKTINN